MDAATESSHSSNKSVGELTTEDLDEIAAARRAYYAQQ